MKVKNGDVPDKPLREYTVGEVQDICEGAGCETCRFLQGDGECPFYCQAPYSWRLGGERRLTEPEIAICRATGARWVSRDKHGYRNLVDLWPVDPKLAENGVWDAASDHVLGRMDAALFPSVHPGECIEVKEATV